MVLHSTGKKIVMNLLFIGDIVGKGGRKAVKELVPELRQEFNCSFCIANAENIAAGSGLAAKCIRDLDGLVDVITSGDHIWDQKKFEHEIKLFDHVLRPANLSKLQPGKGYDLFPDADGNVIAVINLLGRVFVRDSAYCPFETVEYILQELPPTVKVIIVDFHAEATSEMAGMAHFLDGKVTAVLGTHTHVQTADAKVLPEGTAFISDVGMVGGEFSILGREVKAVVEKFRNGMPQRLPVVEKGIRLDAVVISYDIDTGNATAIKNISRMSTV
jgi:metallophosphoesterase (TIGR00282 family)